MRLPKNWNQVNLKQLIELDIIFRDESINKEFAPDIVRSCYVLSVLTGKPYDYFESIPVSEVRSMMSKVAFIHTYPSEKSIQYFNCAGIRWKVNYSVNSMSAGEMIDHYELTKDPGKLLENSVKLMAMYCRPYRLYFFKRKMSKERKQELLSKCPVSVVYPLTLFFCSLYPSLLEATRDYLNQQTKEMESLLKKTG